MSKKTERFFLNIFRGLFHRVTIVAVLLLLQIALLLGMILRFHRYFIVFYVLCIVVSFGVAFWIFSRRMKPVYKIAWVTPILLFPLFGGLFYLLLSSDGISGHARKRMIGIQDKMGAHLAPCPENLALLAGECSQAAVQSQYLSSAGKCPLYRNTQTEFLPSGEIKYRRLLEELSRAEHYIFLEYFIIGEGDMWQNILTVLEEKAAQGVDVRVIYDDMGCLLTLPNHYDKVLEQKGIQCGVFNRAVPVLSSVLNNRDHRKICVIDGYTGFTGGINLADEYINRYPKHGHWKDASILLQGEGVWSLTVMFLSMWDFIKGIEENYEQYRPYVHFAPSQKPNGYVQPFTDNPIDQEPVGQTVYLNLIYRAERYIYINTPYLIMDSEMTTALCSAAKAGVDVRIVTPHIADKWYVHAVTRSRYQELVEAGVKIYEYTPGFIHAKTFVVDGKYGVVGTINLDYRSLYLHFECGVWMYGTSCIERMYWDYLETLRRCQPVTLADCLAVPWYRRLGRLVLQIFSPLM